VKRAAPGKTLRSPLSDNSPHIHHWTKNGHDPTCLRACTQLPLVYACQEADQHTTHQSTESQLARPTLNFMPPIDTHSIITRGPKGQLWPQECTLCW
jgi:hypothetical protein